MHTNTLPKNALAFRLLSAHRLTLVFGGPFRKCPTTHRLSSVKMAKEIAMPCTIDIPTKDFSVPDMSTFNDGLIEALNLMIKGDDLYVGCMGGVGRTGLFLGVLVKVFRDFHTQTGHSVFMGDVPQSIIYYVRKHYNGHAIETDEQMKFVTDYPTGMAVSLLINAYNRELEFYRLNRKPSLLSRIMRSKIVQFFIKE